MKSGNYNERYVFLICSVAAISGLMCGFDIGIMSAAIPFIYKQFSLNGILLGWVVSIFQLGCALGCLFFSYIIPRFGRKKLMIFNCFFLIVTVLGATFLTSVESLCIWRFIRGINIGAALVISVVYIKEVAPEYLQNRMVSLIFFMGVLGFLIAQFAAYIGFDIDNAESWRWMFGSAVIPAFIFYIGAFFIPETPVWLMKVNRNIEAKRVLGKIKVTDRIEDDILSMKMINKRTSVFVLTNDNTLILMLLIVCSNVIQYMQLIFEDENVTQTNGLLIGLFICVVAFLFYILGTQLRDHTKSKLLVNVLSGFMTLVLFVLAWLFQSDSVNMELVLVLFLIYTCTYTFNIGSTALGQIVNYGYDSEPKKSVLRIAILCIAGFLIVLSLPYLIEKEYVNYLLLFCFLNVLNLIYALVSLLDITIARAQGNVSYLESNK